MISSDVRPRFTCLKWRWDYAFCEVRADTIHFTTQTTQHPLHHVIPLCDGVSHMPVAVGKATSDSGLHVHVNG